VSPSFGVNPYHRPDSDLPKPADPEPRARTAPCCCGGLIVAISGIEDEGVRAHQATTLHQRWRAYGGMETEYDLDRLDEERVPSAWIGREATIHTPQWTGEPDP
jgi:hypothetical protein